MSIKRVLCPARLRRIPNQFSWVEQRLVRDEIIGRGGCDALALYLFLITVADAKGPSYYSDQTVVHRLSFDAGRLRKARCDFLQVRLIAFEKPFYQLLALVRLRPLTRTNWTRFPRTTSPVAIGKWIQVKNYCPHTASPRSSKLDPFKSTVAAFLFSS